MYGRLHQRKLNEADFIMSCQKARIQLDDYIDLQSKRVNIDSAKKRAVLQHMDYQGFRQMVLGANIFPTKSAELYSFSKGENHQNVPNKIFLDKPQQRSETFSLTKNQSNCQQVEQLLQKIQGKSQLQFNSFRQFKKKFNFQYTQVLNQQNGQFLYTLLKNQSIGNIQKIFTIDCQASILCKIITVFEFINGYLRQNDQNGKMLKQAVFQVKFLQAILKIKTMKQFSLTILNKKQRTRIVTFLEGCKSLLLGTNIETNNNQEIEKQKRNSQNVVQPQHSEKQNTSSTYEDQKTIDQLICLVSKK